MSTLVRAPRQPTETERAQERSVLYPAFADMASVCLKLVIAVASGSLTVLSDVMRGILTVLALYFSIWAMCMRHRNGLASLQFGLAKLERIVWLVIGVCFLIAGMVLAGTVVSGIIDPPPVPDQLNFAIAATFNAINCLINLTTWSKMFFASRDRSTDSLRALFHARTTILINSMVVQTFLTGAALSRDASVAFWLDNSGAIFVTGLVTYSGIKMIAEAMPDLLDAPGRVDLVEQARAAIDEIGPQSGLSLRRSRRAGLKTFLELEPGDNSQFSGGELRQWFSAVSQKLSHDGLEVELSLATGSDIGPELPTEN